jgi:hypothetical protein
MSKVVPLTPSINEKLIERHLGNDDDPVINELVAAAKLAREHCAKASEVTDAVLQNEMVTLAARHKRARDATFELLHKVTLAIDASAGAAKAEIEKLRTKLKGPVPTRDPVRLARERELRERFAALPAERRQALIDDAINQNHEQLVAAVLSAYPWELGMAPSDHEMLRSFWARKNHPAELARMDRLQKAMDDATMIGGLALKHVDQLTNAALVKSAETSEKAATEALAKARSA